MPYPSRIEPEAVIQKAREMIEAEGAENLSLNQVAAAFNVQTPSLYRYFKSKADLLRAVNLQTSAMLVTALQGAITETDSDAHTQMQAMASGFRVFVYANPRTYALAYSSLAEELRPDPAQLEALVLPLQSVIAQLVGEVNALPALRGLWALMHGFITLELNGQFRRGGDLEATYLQTINAFITGWTTAA